MAKVLADGLDDNFRKNRIMNDVGKMAGMMFTVFSIL